jgi:hypothetical protein
MCQACGAVNYSPVVIRGKFGEHGETSSPVKLTLRIRGAEHNACFDQDVNFGEGSPLYNPMQIPQRT